MNAWTEETFDIFKRSSLGHEPCFQWTRLRSAHEMRNSMYSPLALRVAHGRAARGGAFGALIAISVTACGSTCPPGTVQEGDLCRRADAVSAGAGVDASGQSGTSGGGAGTGAAGIGGMTASAGVGAAATGGAGLMSPPQVVGGSSGGGPATGASDSGAGGPAMGSSGNAAGSAGSMTSGPCPPGAVPATETCDGQDNDCDGHVDEDLDGMPCGSSTQGLCHLGKKSCTAGKWGECVGAVEPKAEVCDPDALDENCDGMSNEHCACTPGKTQACGMTGGICKKGSQTCAADGTWGAACNGNVGPQTEICDGKQDEDCDGLADAQDPDCDCINGKSESCVAGQGSCAAGNRTCVNGKWSDCKPVTGPSKELCDGVDTDCDGSVDNNASCPSGQTCSGGHCVCSDGTHMDCTVASASGPCAAGTKTCQGGQWSACTSSVAPQAELCDGKDNDCNGQIDDGVGDFWFPDCDGDGYAPQTTGTMACTKPTAANGCGWTKQTPSATTADCDDHAATRHPGATFGLPITQAGQGLPASRDFAYDLNCDGKQEPEGFGYWSTGMIKQGQLELVPDCDANTTCNGSLPVCVSSATLLGDIVCGQPYNFQTLCSGTVDVYFLCR
jgi:hypothetical protein